MVGRDTLSWLPFRFAVPWEEITFVVERRAFQRNPVAAVAAVTSSLSEERRERARRQIVSSLPELLYHTIGSRVHENVLRAAAGARCT